VRRLLLVRHAPTAATRAAAFPEDEAVAAQGLVRAPALAAALPSRCSALVSPALRCRQTAAALGLRDAAVEPLLAECDFGVWAGRALADIGDAEPSAVAAWIGDPAARPHGGESLSAFSARVAGWLDGQALVDGAAVAVTHGGVVKAAVVHALGAPLDAFWRIDVAPLSLTELHAHDGRWTVARMNCMADLPRYAGNIRHARVGAGA
jgi:broad specificity phosphatase PhoE